MAKVVLWGTGQIADVVYYYLAKDTDHDICAFALTGLSERADRISRPARRRF